MLALIAVAIAGRPLRGEVAPPISSDLLRSIPRDVVAAYAYGGPAGGAQGNGV